MKLGRRKTSTGIYWLLGTCPILFQPPWASAQTVNTAVVDGAAKAPKTMERPTWLPPDVDEQVPPVEMAGTCSLEEVVQNAEKRILEFVRDVERFTATESLTHESINKHGRASGPVLRRFDYVVSIQEIRQGHLGVTEYRNGGLPNEFPDGIVTNGLPALVLILHPYYAPNYEMTCEGLSRSSGRLVWQVHFRQWPDKPNEIKAYQYGFNGASYAVGLKGRFWIDADSYQIVRMETDLVAPMPQIQLLVEHTTIEYGPVKFRESDVNLWLPQNAEVYFAWRGRQVHRRHSFDHYMLFSVNDKQKITPPSL